MKSTSKGIVLLLALLIFSSIAPKQTFAQQGAVSFQVFYDQLSPYGHWINYSNYGYVWIPNAGSDFIPYSTAGHWILTDYGWTWVSDYSWGWAPFHYGRWDFDNSYGWLWIPDNEWGPAWVTWRRADGYYGWQPMEPQMSISLSFGRPYNKSYDHWMFVRDRDFERSDINHYFVNRSDHDRIIKNSTVINKTYYDNKRHTTYVTGPAREDVQKVTGKKVNPVAVQENNKPGQSLSNGQLHIYRPLVSNNNNQYIKPGSAKTVNEKDTKKVADQKTRIQTQKVNQSVKLQQERKPLSVSPSKNYEKKTQLSKTQNASSSLKTAQLNKSTALVRSNNNSRKTQISKPQNVRPSNNFQQNQANNVKPTNQQRREQPKESKAENNRK
jgi:hypothetical protein